MKQVFIVPNDFVGNSFLNLAREYLTEGKKIRCHGRGQINKKKNPVSIPLCNAKRIGIYIEDPKQQLLDKETHCNWLIKYTEACHTDWKKLAKEELIKKIDQIEYDSFQRTNKAIHVLDKHNIDRYKRLIKRFAFFGFVLTIRRTNRTNSK